MGKFYKTAIYALLVIIVFIVLWYAFRIASRLILFLFILAVSIFIASIIYKEIKRHFLKCLVFFIVLLCQISPAASEIKIVPSTIADDSANPRSLSMGNAVRAASFGTSGLYFNPAGMSQIYQYAIETGYSYSDWKSGHVFHVSVIDSKTNQNLGAGVGYSYLWNEFPKAGEDPAVTRSGHLIRAAISGGAQYDFIRLMIGGGLKYCDIKRSDDFSLTSTNFDVGAIIGLFDQFFIGVVGYNILNRKNPEMPIGLGTGAAFKYMNFLLSFDALLDFKTTEKKKINYMFGTEYIFFQIISIRAGFKMDGLLEKDSASAGIGYISDLFGLDIGYMQDIHERKYSTINAAARFFLP
jgi:hypothetical protein